MPRAEIPAEPIFPFLPDAHAGREDDMQGPLDRFLTEADRVATNLFLTLGTNIRGAVSGIDKDRCAARGSGVTEDTFTPSAQKNLAGKH